jgi:hypothetical protein
MTEVNEKKWMRQPHSACLLTRWALPPNYSAINFNFEDKYVNISIYTLLHMLFTLKDWPIDSQQLPTETDNTFQQSQISSTLFTLLTNREKYVLHGLKTITVSCIVIL